MAEEQQTGLAASLQNFLKSFDRPASWYVEITGYLIAGFIVGFLVKHAGRLFFLLLLGALLALIALEFLQIVTVNYSVFRTVLGISAETTIQDLINIASAWLRTHILESLAALFGFIIAWKFA